MRLYIDTEFNGHGGELISLAIAGNDGSHFYGVLTINAPVDPWVAEHVMPHLNRAPEPYSEFRKRLQVYMQDRDGAAIYADWPADFEHLTRVMCGGSYDESWMANCSMHLVKETNPAPKQPHNALSDAVALHDWFERRFAE